MEAIMNPYNNSYLRIFPVACAITEIGEFKIFINIDIITKEEKTAVYSGTLLPNHKFKICFISIIIGKAITSIKTNDIFDIENSKKFALLYSLAEYDWINCGRNATIMFAEKYCIADII